MEMKNICGKIPLELHAKVRGEIEQRDICTQEFLQQVIEEHFMEKGVEQMAARTIAVQVTEELFGRLKAVLAWKGCKQKDFLTSIIEKAIEEIEAEQESARREKEALICAGGGERGKVERCVRKGIHLGALSPCILR